LSLSISGHPRLSTPDADGTHSFTGNGASVADITGWNLSTLTIYTT